MKLLSLSFIIALLLVVKSGFAQSGNILTQTRVWKSEVGYSLTTPDTLTLHMSFTTVGSDRIEHHDHKNRLQTFDIVSTEGSWTDISIPGNITYHVSINEQQGLITLARDSSGVTLVVDFSNSQSGGVKNKYIINAIE